jgi:hypothetical protein
LSAYEAARAMLPASALAIADELVACAPPLTEWQKNVIRRNLGPHVLAVADEPAQAQATSLAARCGPRRDRGRGPCPRRDVADQ